MAFTWDPGIYRSGVFKGLPHPVLRLEIMDQWSMQTSKVPRRSGGRTAGHSLDPVTIEIAGEMAKRDAVNHMTEKEMFLLYEEVRGRANVTNEDRFEFYIYRDPSDAQNYRKMLECYPVSMKLSLGDEDRNPFAYALTIQADDPTIYKGTSG